MFIDRFVGAVSRDTFTSAAARIRDSEGFDEGPVNEQDLSSLSLKPWPSSDEGLTVLEFFSGIG